jgi:hypothetical protein
MHPYPHNRPEANYSKHACRTKHPIVLQSDRMSMCEAVGPQPSPVPGQQWLRCLIHAPVQTLRLSIRSQQRPWPSYSLLHNAITYSELDELALARVPMRLLWPRPPRSFWLLSPLLPFAPALWLEPRHLLIFELYTERFDDAQRSAPKQRDLQKEQTPHQPSVCQVSPEAYYKFANFVKIHNEVNRSAY